MDWVVSAVKALRQHLGDSQQAFANRLGLSIRAIANYEKDRRPTGMALVLLARAATAAGKKDLVTPFMSALVEELGLKDIPVRLMSLYRTGDEIQGLFLAHLDDKESMDYALAFWGALEDLSSDVPERKARARNRLGQLKATMGVDPKGQAPEGRSRPRKNK